MDLGRILEVILVVFWMPKRAQNRSGEHVKNICFPKGKHRFLMFEGDSFGNKIDEKWSQKQRSFLGGFLSDFWRILELFSEPKSITQQCKMEVEIGHVSMNLGTSPGGPMDPGNVPK